MGGTGVPGGNLRLSAERSQTPHLSATNLKWGSNPRSQR